MMYGYVRAAAASPEIRVADCVFNRHVIIETIYEASKLGTDIIVFPELCMTGSTCGDLFFQENLVREAENSLQLIAEYTTGKNILVVVGLPYIFSEKLYNCAAVLHEGTVLGVVPKTYLDDHSELYESRYFKPGRNAGMLPSPQLLFKFSDIPEVTLAVEIGNDLHAVIPPSSHHIRAGATLVANPSADNEQTGKDEYRRSLITNQSAKGICGYIYSCAGEGESTTDLVFSSHSLIAENGKILAESPRFQNGIIYTDIDVNLLCSERRRKTTDRDDHGYETIIVHRKNSRSKTENLMRDVDPMPFVPSDPALLAKRCEEVLTLQALGLKKRMKHLNMRNVVLGISGGLDSTLALLVCRRAFDLIELPHYDIHCVIMPCFGTSEHTWENAVKLTQLSGGTLREVPISEAVNLHFSDIGHDPQVHDLTYENAQARERTQVLMDISSQVKGLVVGTGDLSELALGFTTYNGDHMSMYGVNASVPKTLIRHLIAYEAGLSNSKSLSDVLHAILKTPVSPELLPPEAGGISQKTESILGPYEVHDFFLYNVIRRGFLPEKILYLAQIAFKGRYSDDKLVQWLALFYQRFFANQFKRSCMPDGPKVGSVTLSPRGGWRMPSDASVELWLEILTGRSQL